MPRATAPSGFAAALAIVTATALAPAADAANPRAPRPLATGFSEARYMSADPQVRAALFDQTLAAGASYVRLTADWRAISRGVPADPRDPADPAYDFGLIDAAVRDADARGLVALVQVASAPEYAEAPDRPGSAAPGSWRPDPEALGAFATAIARRYSGHYSGLPRVGAFQLWNEPNLARFLTPQWSGGELAAAVHYRAMLNAFYAAVKAVDSALLVATGGTAPYGDPPGGPRSAPLAFWREVLCLDGGRKPERVPCPAKPRFDVLAHHPINTVGGPEEKSPGPDDVSTAEFGKLRSLLRAAERLGTVGTEGRHPLWATELWWDTKPPDAFEGVALRRHARWIARALHLLSRQGAEVVLNFQVRDLEYDPNDPFADTSSGVAFIDGTPKPAMTAFRFPLVAERRKNGRIVVWGRSPASGRLAIRRRARGLWVRVTSTQVIAGEVFKARLHLRGRQRLQARVGDERSLVWRRGGARDESSGAGSPGVAPIVAGEYASLEQYCGARVDGLALQGAAAGERIRGTANRDLLRGGPGGDRLAGGGGGDCLQGQAGDDRIGGGVGTDVIQGGWGKDRIGAGSGKDRITAADGARDTVACGPGVDEVLADAADLVARSCERVRGR